MKTSCVRIGRFLVLRLPDHMGLGGALRLGVEHCSNELICRMDSDDISVPTRCERQLAAFGDDPALSLCSGYIAEFTADECHPTGIRKVPVTHQDILRYARRRNPMNHMAVMFRKSAVMAAGGYVELPLAEDYYLWVRMLHCGCVAANLGEVLVYARTGASMYGRRGGAGYVKKMLRVQRAMLDLGFIDRRTYVCNCVIRALVGLVPNRVRGVVYEKGLRES
ncbi:MAG: glycosyltransferase [Lachnospiraceae bacterium]|nr:glycosyltransferase [Lachnospiraceae bacterium]